MAKCPNCGNTYGCGCQKRVTATGKEACAKCINALNQKIASERKDTSPIIKNVQINSN
jgi:hypothetical protein